MMSGRAVAAILALVAAGFATQHAAAAPPTSPEVFPSASGAGAGEFQQALSPRPFAFPRDHGPHPGFRHEWWYVTGNLDTPSGERFGFELTFFRFALAPPQSARADARPGGDSPAPAVPSAWRTTEAYLAHFAVSDVAQHRFRFAQKLSRGALGLAGAQALPLHVWIDDWSLESTAAAGGATEAPWRLRAAQPGYELDLTLEPQGEPVPNGDAGLSRKSDRPEDANYYYSIPRVSVRGRLLRGSETVAVNGLAWLDREWGSGGLGPTQEGWDWFALQLDDGSALMFYALRDRGGGRDRHSAGTWIAADGVPRALADADVAISVTGEWRNPDGARYPARWQIRVPTLDLDVSVRPVLADQELRTSPRYWEGAVDVSGERAGRRIGGRGYVELVGYAPER
jgi:predicted secreted hydrolase